MILHATIDLNNKLYPQRPNYNFNKLCSITVHTRQPTSRRRQRNVFIDVEDKTL